MTRSGADRSPRPATGVPAACWWSAPGAICIRPGSGAPSSPRSTPRRRRCARLPGRRTPAVSALSRVDQEGQAQDRRHRGDRARARRLHLGGRSRRHAARVACSFRSSEGSPAETPNHNQGPCAGAWSGQEVNLVQRRERSRGKGNTRSSCVADRRSTPDLRPGQPQTEKRTCVNPRIRAC